MNAEWTPILNSSLICLGGIIGGLLGWTWGRLKAAQLPEEMFRNLVQRPLLAVLAALSLLLFLVGAWWGLGLMLLSFAVFCRSREDLKRLGREIAESIFGPRQGRLGRWSRPVWILIQLVWVGCFVWIQNVSPFLPHAIGVQVLCGVVECFIKLTDPNELDEVRREPWFRLIMSMLGVVFWVYVLNWFGVWSLETVRFWPAVGIAFACSRIADRLWTVIWILTHPSLLSIRRRMQRA